MRGEYKYRVGAAMCRFCGLDKVCNLGWGVLVAKNTFPVVSHNLTILVSEFEGLCDLCIGCVWSFPEVV